MMSEPCGFTFRRASLQRAMSQSAYALALGHWLSQRSRTIPKYGGSIRKRSTEPSRRALKNFSASAATT